MGLRFGTKEDALTYMINGIYSNSHHKTTPSPEKQPNYFPF